ncbi:MAG: sialate O-acetylesterase [Planctomycetota bacterium]
MLRLRSVVSAATAAALCCALLPAQQLQVYVLVGQSNMQGHAKVQTFDYLGDDPKTAPLLARMRDDDGAPVVLDDVRIAYLTGGRDGDQEVTGKLTAGFGARRNPQQSDDKIGPEFTFGLRMAERHDGPVLLIKCAWGGKSLHTDFRPPSAGPYPFSEQQLAQIAERHRHEKRKGPSVEQAKADKLAKTGRYYRSTIAYVQKVLADLKAYHPDYDAEAGYQLGGFVWFQGWNDMVDRGTYPARDRAGGYDRYSECLAHFIRDVRKDLDAPKLPFVIGVMGVGGPVEAGQKRAVHQNFRDAMAAPAAMQEFLGNVAAVPTDPYWSQELDEIGQRIGKVQQMARMLRTENQRGPNADGSMDKQAQQAYLAKYRAEIVGAEDDATYRRGASNGGYHYLGCAKTMAQIGVAFADAVHALR